jgi:chromosome transmission fidelity protein 1
MTRLGGSNDQVNLMEMVKYLRESKLARKVSGFAEKSAEELARKCKLSWAVVRRKSAYNIATTAGSKSHANGAAKHASIAAFHQVEAFLLSLSDARDDGRIILSTEDRGGKAVVSMKYMLLNPAERFKEVVESARCVILAGGTMEPVGSLIRSDAIKLT